MARLSQIVGTSFPTVGTSGVHHVATLAKLNVFNDLSLERPERSESASATVPNRVCTAPEAVETFLGTVTEWIEPGEQLAFKWWCHAYNGWRREAGGPEMSDKVLSRALQDAGCVRRVVDERRKGGKKFVAFEMRG